MTLANKITIVRILLVPFFILEILLYQRTGDGLHRWLGLALFAAVSLSDAVDGYVARRFAQRSELGAILDPLADKLLLVSAVLLLSIRNPHLPVLPFWLTLTILSRDVLLVIGLVLLHVTTGSAQVRPRLEGKVATVLQMAAVVWTLLALPERGGGYVAGAATLMTLISGLRYLGDGVARLSASPGSGPTPGQPDPRQ